MLLSACSVLSLGAIATLAGNDADYLHMWVVPNFTLAILPLIIWRSNSVWNCKLLHLGQHNFRGEFADTM